ncbi:uroporphyrinogen-III C-methyltransferase [Xanthomonas campestris]|nr:uroporphyrinogen-III C-methyltransferase [Xanthomonas campestris]RFF57791.1 uroporphyrinogen-III C-methyltransferase [Xanthomonas campestris]
MLNSSSRCRDVVLLSAGPGDLELLTLKAVKALATAQVLLLDDLANPQIVELAPQARVIRVGKRGGCRSTPQDFICRLMRRYALQGVQVVRVKGGDALLFGRAGEEVAFLRAAGVGVQVINGVSAAFAAAAALEVSLTHRAHCHGITFVTAHTHDHGGPNWGALAASGTTLGIYMGLRRADAVASALLAHLPASTPAAIVQAATRAEQQRRLTTLGELGRIAATLPPDLPTLLLLGGAMAEANAACDDSLGLLLQQAVG